MKKSGMYEELRLFIGNPVIKSGKFRKGKSGWAGVLTNLDKVSEGCLC